MTHSGRQRKVRVDPRRFRRDGRSMLAEAFGGLHPCRGAVRATCRGPRGNACLGDAVSVRVGVEAELTMQADSDRIYVRAASLSDLPDAGLLRFVVNGHVRVLAHTTQGVCALDGICTHEHAELADGETRRTRFSGVRFTRPDSTCIPGSRHSPQAGHCGRMTCVCRTA